MTRISSHRDTRKEFIMTVERALRLIAGSFVVLSVLLGMFVNTAFLWLTVFVGLNLFQSAFTNWCPMMVILRRSGLRNAGQTGRAVTSAP
jgi:Inner membrane protein YgaP-like, transmembrane domain